MQWAHFEQEDFRYIYQQCNVGDFNCDKDHQMTPRSFNFHPTFLKEGGGWTKANFEKRRHQIGDKVAATICCRLYKMTLHFSHRISKTAIAVSDIQVLKRKRVQACSRDRWLSQRLARSSPRWGWTWACWATGWCSWPVVRVEQSSNHVQQDKLEDTGFIFVHTSLLSIREMPNSGLELCNLQMPCSHKSLTY